MRNHSFLTSVIDRIPSPLGPKPSSIFNDKSALLSCKKKIKKSIPKVLSITPFKTNNLKFKTNTQVFAEMKENNLNPTLRHD